MNTGNFHAQLNQDHYQWLLTVLERFAHSAGMTFDRSLASRLLTETEQAIGGSGSKAWASRLVEIGKSIHVRIRSIDCSLDEALNFVRQDIPVAVSLEGSDPDATTLTWAILLDSRGQQVLVLQPDKNNLESWISLRELQKLVGLSKRSDSRNWIIGQAALGCSPPEVTSPHLPSPKKLSPFTRLMHFIQPEKRDLWIVLIFSLVVGILALATPIAVEALVNTVAFGRYLQPVVILSLLLFTFLVFAAMMRGLITYVVEILQRRLFIRVVEDLAYRIPRVKQEQFDSKYGPEALNRFFDIVTVQKTVASLVLDGISIVLQTVIGMAVLAFYHPFLLGFDIALLIFIAVAVFGLGYGAVDTAIKESKAKYKIADWLQELARHPTAFKLHSGNQLAIDKADELAIHWLNMRRAHFKIVLRQILFALGLQAVAATALLGLGGWLVILGELTLGQLVAAELIVMMIVSSFAKIGKHMESAYDLLASVDKLGQLFDLEIEAQNKFFHIREGEPASICAKNVSYQYPLGTGISAQNLEIHAGETIALMGPAGAGKTTLVELLCGVRQPTSGHIELDGVDIRELRPDSLREHLTLADEIEIFHGTLSENVHLNRTNVRASDVRKALDTCCLLEEVLALPDGIDTELQTGGAPLTKSQSIRLMLARAIAAQPRFLLIDGALDRLSDEELDRLLDRIVSKEHNRTTLIVTGRQQIVEICDRVVELTPPPKQKAVSATVH